MTEQELFSDLGRGAQEVVDDEAVNEDSTEAELKRFQKDVRNAYESLREETPETNKVTALLSELCEVGTITSVEQLRHYAREIVIAREDRTYDNGQFTLDEEVNYAASFHNGTLVLYPQFFAGPKNNPDVASNPSRLWEWQRHIVSHELGESIQAPRERNGERIEYLDMEAYRAILETRDPEWNTPYLRAVHASAARANMPEAMADYYREAGADDIARYLQSHDWETWRDLLIRSVSPEKQHALYAQMKDPEILQDSNSEIARFNAYAQNVYQFLDGQLASHRLPTQAARDKSEDLLTSTSLGGFNHGTFDMGGTDTKIIDKVFDFFFLRAYGA